MELPIQASEAAPLAELIFNAAEGKPLNKHLQRWHDLAVYQLEDERYVLFIGYECKRREESAFHLRNRESLVSRRNVEEWRRRSDQIPAYQE